MEKDWLFRTDEYICDLRTVGVLVRDGKLLVQRERNGSEYALPGGHVKIGETTADGLIREYKEETGVDISLTNSSGRRNASGSGMETRHTTLHSTT